MDGSSWSALGSGANNTVHALAASGTDLYAGGWFTAIGGINANYVARWDGLRWWGLGEGVGGVVHAIAFGGTNVYVAGQFSTAGGSTRTISPVGTGVSGHPWVAD